MTQQHNEKLHDAQELNREDLSEVAGGATPVMYRYRCCDCKRDFVQAEKKCPFCSGTNVYPVIPKPIV